MGLATRLVLGTVIAGAVTLGAQPTFQGGIDLATFGVTVLDRRNELVTGLTREEFEVLEDGRPQRVDLFARGDGERSPAMHVGLMLDASGSMAMDLKLARSAAIRFLNLLPEAQDVTLVDFDTQVRITKYPQRDFPRLIERIRQRKPDGWTALYDALGTYLDGADQQEGRTVMVPAAKETTATCPDLSASLPSCASSELSVAEDRW